MNRLLSSIAFASLACTGTAAAQEMGQGAAHITTRTDVRLSLESVPGTSSTRLTALGRAVGAGMSGMRACYGQVTAARPGVAGRLRLRVSLGASGGPEIEVVEDGPHDRELLTCMRGVIARQPMTDVGRPAAAIVVLELDNSAAAGAAATAQRATEADTVAVTNEGGRPTAIGEAPGLRFAVRGAVGMRDELVAEGLRVVRSQIAGMLDCRRRASRRGMDPVGQVALRMQMRSGRPPTITAGESSVRDERAPQCLERTLGHPNRQPAAGPAQLDIEVRFLAD